MNKNNFDTVRICLALIVVIGHIAILTQLEDYKFILHFFDSNFAVKGFFAISGFLVTKSYINSLDNLHYFRKRFIRIYPAYFINILICFFIGCCLTKVNLVVFLTSTESASYLVSNLLLLNFLHPAVWDVFSSNPFKAMNGSLWTIKIEFMLYFCLPTIIYLFNRFGALKVTFVLYILSVFWVYYFKFLYHSIESIIWINQFPGQISYFVIGSLMFVDKKVFSKLKQISFISIVLIFTVDNHFVKIFTDPIAYSSIIIFLSTSAIKRLNIWKSSDISYGLYLYHFPIIQSLIYFGIFKFNPLIGFVTTIVLTLLFSLLSWHLVERKLIRRHEIC